MLFDFGFKNLISITGKPFKNLTFAVFIPGLIFLQKN